ncbi:MAG: ABC transporter ATP-binding protein [Chloroflexota bacterium]
MIELENATDTVRLEDVSKVYTIGKGKLTVLNHVNINIKKGEMVAIMGPSGSGKTTTLNLIGCLDRPTSGKYFLDGREVSSLNSNELALVRGQKIGFIFQTFNLLSRLSALANVELGMTYAGGVDRKRAVEALARVGLAQRMKHRPIELSGGEQQRVAIARAMAKNPSLFLCDEPTGQLDSHSGHEVMVILTSLHAERGITVVVVTHDETIARHCQRIIHFRDGQVVREETGAAHRQHPPDFENGQDVSEEKV